MMRNSFCWLQWEDSATGKIQQNIRIQITKLIQNKTRQCFLFFFLSNSNKQKTDTTTYLGYKPDK